MFPPSPQTVVDGTTHTAIPSDILCQPAIDPPTFNLVLRSDKFPWLIVVQPSAYATESSPVKLKLGDRNSWNSKDIPITNDDLVHALHRTLSLRVTQQEWDALGKDSPAQLQATVGYVRRTRALGDAGGGVRRIDWLGEATQLIGIEAEKTSDNNMAVARLVFGKP